MYDEDNPLGLDYTPNIGDAFNQLGGMLQGGIRQIGGAIKYAPTFLTQVRESFKPENQPQTEPSIMVTPETLGEAENTASDYIASGVEYIGDKLGVSRDISTPIAGAAGALLTPGVGDLKIAGGAVVLATGLSVTDPRILKHIPNVKPGIGKADEFVEGVGKLRAQGAADAARRQNFMEQFAAGEIDRNTLTERLSKVKKRGDAKYSTLATPDDPDIFEKRAFQNPDPTNPEFMADQHHATTKAMTTPWVKKALELGDDDDVVALFELHRALTGSGMGNVRSGIIDVPGGAHDTAKAKKRGMDPKLAIHSFFKESGAGVEIRTDKVEKIIGNPTNMDELLEKYITFAQEYLIPQKELSLKRLNQVLSEHRRTIPPLERAAFDDMVDKLNKGGTP